MTAANVDPLTGRPKVSLIPAYDATSFAAECGNESSDPIYLGIVGDQLGKVIRGSTKLDYYLNAGTAPEPFKHFARLIDFAKGNRGRPFYSQKEAEALLISPTYRPGGMDPFYVSRTDEVVNYLYERFDTETPFWISGITDLLHPQLPVTRQSIISALESCTDQNTYLAPPPIPTDPMVRAWIYALVKYGAYLGPRPNCLPPVVDRLGVYKSRFLDAKHILSWPVPVPCECCTHTEAGPAQTNRFRCTACTKNHMMYYMGEANSAIGQRARTFRKYGDLIDYGLGRGPRPNWLPTPTGPFANNLRDITMDVSPYSP